MATIKCLTGGEQGHSVGCKTQELGKSGLGGRKKFSEAFLLKKTTRKPIAYYLAPMEVIPCLTYSGIMETKKARAFRFIKFCI